MRPTKTQSLLFLSFFFASLADAGVYKDVVDCGNPISQDFCVQGETSDPVPANRDPINPFGIVHPLGFDDSSSPGILTIPICVKLESQELAGPTQRAIATWNALTPTSGQCRRCYVHEDGGVSSGPLPFHAETVLLHELGHCVMGLDHTDLEYDPPGAPDARIPTSFTMSYGGLAADIDNGPDNVPGSFDDAQEGPGGQLPDSVHWFRTADNNPVKIDGTVIDILTYSRSVVTNLPTGHGWAANANRLVAESLGSPETQSVMYSAAAPLQRYAGLTADDVNMVRMGMSGLDRMAGTSDDYVVQLLYVESCQDADVEVSFSPELPTQTLARCIAGVDFSIPGQNPFTARHYSIVKPSGFAWLFVELNAKDNWDLREEIFYDGFESGDLTAWTSVLP